MSEKHYQLTYAEAKEFLQLSHQGENRGNSLPAQPAWSLAPPALLGNRDLETYDFDVTVDLDDRGTVVGIHETDLIVPDPVKALVREMTFVPALENGLPVASTLTINPADFYRD